MLLLDGWLVFPSDQQITWFDKEGNQSETTPKWDNATKFSSIYASRSVFLFKFRDESLLMKRLCDDGDNTSKHLIS